MANILERLCAGVRVPRIRRNLFGDQPTTRSHNITWLSFASSLPHLSA